LINIPVKCIAQSKLFLCYTVIFWTKNIDLSHEENLEKNLFNVLSSCLHSDISIASAFFPGIDPKKKLAQGCPAIEPGLVTCIFYPLLYPCTIGVALQT
jgi:hypothetical protein